MIRLRRFSAVALAFLLTLVSALPVSAGVIINPTTVETLTVAGQTIGDLIYADSTSSFTRLADVADGSVLRSGGVGAAPVYGKVRLSGATVDVTGTLPYGSGGTGATSYTTNRILKAGASAFADSLLSDDGTNVTLASGQLLLPDGTAALPSASFANFPTTGLRVAAGPLLFFVRNAIDAVVIGGSSFRLISGHDISWSSSATDPSAAADLLLARDAANTLAQQNGTNAQTFRGYGTYTDASNYERWALSATAGGGITLAAETAGTGADNLNITLTPAGTGVVQTAARFELGGGVKTLIGQLGIGLGVTPPNSYNQIQGAGSIIISPAASPDGVLINVGYGLAISSGGLAISGTGTPSSPAISAGSGTGLTANIGAEVRRVTYKVTVTYAALAAAATTADKTIATLPAKTRLVGIVAETTTPYTGGGVTAATLIVGKSVGGNEYVVSHDVLSAAVVKGNADADLGTAINRANAVQGGDLPSWSGTTVVSVRLTTVTANTDQLTAGSTTYYLTTEVMP